jgi:hypothetical protein
MSLSRSDIALMRRKLCVLVAIVGILGSLSILQPVFAPGDDHMETFSSRIAF